MATKGQADVLTRYPVVEGLTSGTTRQTGERFLVRSAEKSFLSSIEKTGLGG